MWALVESNNITKVYPRPTAVTIGFVAATYHTENVLYVEGDKPFPEPEISVGDIKIAIGDLKTPRLGTNYPANIMSMWTASELEAIGIYAVVEDNTNLKDATYYNNGAQSFVFENDTVTKRFGVSSAKDLDQLKSSRKTRINSRASTMLATYDWYTLREAGGGTAVPAAITTYQTAVRLRSNEHATTIDAVSTVDELAALTYAWPDDPVV